MVHRIGRFVAVAVLAFAVAATPASAQLDTNLSALTGDQAIGYLRPFASGISATLNSGLFRSGDVPLVGFNFGLDINAMVMSFSDDDRVFTTPDVLRFGTTEAPTVIGDTQSVTQNGSAGTTLFYPGGFDMEKFPMATPQLTIGSVAGTRAIIRYLSVSLGDEGDDIGDLSLFGIGGQHSVSQYFPGLPMDVALGVMWQTFSLGEDDLVSASSLALNVTGSKKFGAVITFEPFVGLGMDSFSMESEYTSDSGTETITVEFDRENDFHGTIGANLNIPFLKLHAEYTAAAANGYVVGITFGT